MDITKSGNKASTTKLINGETINFGLFYLLGFLGFIIIKQVLKGTIFGLASSIAMPISFVLVALVLFILEKKYVFTHKVGTRLPRQILAVALRSVVDVGFYLIFDFVFVTILKMSSALPFIFAFAMILVFNYYFDKLVAFDSVAKAEDNKNGRIYKAFFSNRFVVLSMLVAFVGIMFVYLVFKLFPFGDYTVLRMDLYHQYGPLFVEFYDRITQHKSFLYSWQSGGGSSFLGNYFNYLSSPLSLLVFLFDREQVGYAISTLVVVKGLLSAGTFTYFIKKSLNRHSYASAAFGVFYAFNGYFLAYYWNIMWIDGMILLPLIALGIERIINEGKGKTYIISLALLMYCSYYMGYMACIFSVAYFLMYYFAHYSASDTYTKLPKKANIFKKITNSKFLTSGVRFGIASILTAALCACFLIPVYFILQSCSATSDTFPSAMTSEFDLLNMVSSHLAGLETTIRSSGDDVLPNIYCGILAVLLVPLYLVNKDIRLKEKVAYVLMIVFFVFSFDCNMTNFIWHAMHFPNDLPYRFSYMYVFIMLIMAFRGLMHIKSINYKDIMATGMGALLIILILQKFPTNKINNLSIYLSIGMVMIWTLVLLMIKKGHFSKLVIGVTILCMTFCEVIIGDSNSYLFTEEQRPYTANMQTYKNAFDYLKKTDKDFYRTELTYLDTRMDPCLYGYNGMSIFSSMAYEDYSQSQYSLGMFGNRINSYTYNTQTPVYNMMFALKYLVKSDESSDPSSEYYTKVYTTEDKRETEVYKNDYYLPIAFTASSNLENWDNSEGNPFDVQENLIDLAAGVSNVFIPVEYVSTEAFTVDCEDVTENGTYIYDGAGEDNYGTIDIDVRAVNDGNMFVYIACDSIENVNYYWDDEQESIYQNINEPYIKDLGYHNAGDIVTISLDLSGTDNDGAAFQIYAYNVDKNVLDSAYELLSLGQLNIEKYSDTKLEGTINAGFDGYLYTSIPYDEGWEIYIDDVKAKTFSLGQRRNMVADKEKVNSNCHLCTTIKQGEHKVKLVYKPKGQKYGLVISAGAAVVLAGFELFKNRRKLNKSKNSN